jgi:DNA-3-methyladenine glycosylase II
MTGVDHEVTVHANTAPPRDLTTPHTAPIHQSVPAAEATVCVTVPLPDPVDVPASVEFLRRNGDDLLDRWDGTRLVRVLVLHGKRVPVAMRPTGGHAAPSLVVTLPTAVAAELDQDTLHTAVTSQFAVPPASWAGLLGADPALAALAAQSPAIRPLSLTDPFYALVRAITAQQVHLKFATAIRARLAQRFGCEYRVDGKPVFALEPEALAGAAVSTLRNLQLSERKASYLIGTAEAILDGWLDIPTLAALTDDEYLEAMTRLHGIGRWTAEWFAVRVLGRAVVVAGDIGVRKAVGRLYGVAMPTELQVRQLTAHWGPAAHIAQQLVLETYPRPTTAGPTGSPPQQTS